MRNLMVLGAAALLVVTMVAEASAQCCGTAAPSWGYAAPAYHGGCGDCYSGGCATQCCDQGYRAPRVRVFARRQNCCPQQTCCPQPCYQPHNYCCAQPNCGGNNYCGTGCCNNTMVACQPSGCGSCGSMYTGTTMGCGCNSGMVYSSGMVTSGCPGCVQGQMIMEGGAPTPAQGTIIEPGTENTPSAPANNNAAPPTPEDA